MLGKEVKCKVSGATGIVVSRHDYLNGCIRYSVQGKIKEDGKIPDEFHLDENQIEEIGPGVCLEKKNTGGPPRCNPPHA